MFFPGASGWTAQASLAKKGDKKCNYVYSFANKLLGVAEAPVDHATLQPCNGTPFLMFFFLKSLFYTILV